MFPGSHSSRYLFELSPRIPTVQDHVAWNRAHTFAMRESVFVSVCACLFVCVCVSVCANKNCSMCPIARTLERDTLQPDTSKACHYNLVEDA